MNEGKHQMLRRRQIENSTVWEYFTAPEYDLAKITGKYLFFSEDRALLISIACFEIREHGFKAAKVSRHPKNDYVLCLYWTGNDRKQELAKRYRHREKEVRYRYWKSDADTRAGIYSTEFNDQGE